MRRPKEVKFFKSARSNTLGFGVVSWVVYIRDPQYIVLPFEVAVLWYTTLLILHVHRKYASRVMYPRFLQCTTSNIVPAPRRGHDILLVPLVLLDFQSSAWFGSACCWCSGSVLSILAPLACCKHVSIPPLWSCLSVVAELCCLLLGYWPIAAVALVCSTNSFYFAYIRLALFSAGVAAGSRVMMVMIGLTAIVFWIQ